MNTLARRNSPPTLLRFKRDISVELAKSNVNVAGGPLGLSVFAAKRIPAGIKVLRLDGPVRGLAEVDRSYSETPREDYLLQIGRTRWIDLNPPGRFVNHSCEPSCGIRGGNWLVSLGDIEIGQEITYDYSTTTIEPSWRMACRCGGENCRVVIGDIASLSEDLRQKYLKLDIIPRFVRCSLSGEAEPEVPAFSDAEDSGFDHIELRPSKVHGFGVFALRNFGIGELVTRFGGELVAAEEVAKLEGIDHYLQIADEWYLGPEGNINDYFNHSCEPTCGLRFDSAGADLVAIRPIKRDDELTFDYSTSMDEEPREIICECGAQKCRGRIRDFKYLPADLQDYYCTLGVVPKFILEKTLQHLQELSQPSPTPVFDAIATPGLPAARRVS